MEVARDEVVIASAEPWIRSWESNLEHVLRKPVRRVLADGEPVLVEDALSDQRFAQTESILRMRIRSVLAAPLEVDGVPSGVLYLESRTLDRLVDYLEYIQVAE